MAPGLPSGPRASGPASGRGGSSPRARGRRRRPPRAASTGPPASRRRAADPRRRQFGAALVVPARPRLEIVGEPLDEFPGAGSGGRGTQCVVVGETVEVSEADVVTNRQLVAGEVLEHRRESRLGGRRGPRRPGPRRSSGCARGSAGAQAARRFWRGLISDPFRPTMATTCPAAMSNVTSCNTGRSVPG